MKHIPCDIEGYGDHIAISVTNSCPLRCGHCISGSAPDTPRGAEGLVDSLGQFLDAWPKVKKVTFTGGEPFHDPEKLASFGECVDERDRRYYIITGAFWAKTLASCKRYLDYVPRLAGLTISTDLYHQQFVKIDHVLNAVHAARSRGIKLKVRLTHSEAMTFEEKEAERRLRDNLQERELELQPLQQYGRAQNNGIGREYDRWAGPSVENKYGACPSTGPHIYETGRVIPCCNTIVSLRDITHPLEFGNVMRDNDEALKSKIERNTFWKMIKVLGFDWLKEQLEALNPELRNYSPIDACDFCFDCCNPGEIRTLVEQLLSDPKIALYIHSLASYLNPYHEENFLVSELALEVQKRQERIPAVVV